MKWIFLPLALCGCSAMNKEVRMPVSDEVAKAVQERDEARQIQRLLAEGWQNEKEKMARLIGLYADLHLQLEAQTLRDKLRREEALHNAADLEIATLRATINNLEHRLDQPLVMPGPSEIGIELAPIEDRYP